MKILITGGAGFIGSHLADELIKQGHEVRIIDDLSTGKLSFIRSRIKDKRLQLFEGPVQDRKLLQEAMKHCDIVFHLAAVLGVKNTIDDPLKVIEGNIDGTRSVLEAAYQEQIKVIFASTSEVYGKNEQLPFSEDSSRVLGPTTKHRWCYATAKALDEHMCLAYAKKGLPVTIVRYFNAYGPRATATQYGGVIPKFIMAALQNKPITVYGSGEQTRCFTYVSDMLDGTISCMDSQYNNQVFNIGTEQEISINQLAYKIKSLCGSASSIVHIPYEKAYGKGYEDTSNRVPDLTKSKSFLNYSPVVKIDEGLIKTIDWYRSELSSN